MTAKQFKLSVNELTTGMFVSGLDRPWTQTPFPVQGFYIRNLEEIRQLRMHCEFVYIDVNKGSRPLVVNPLQGASLKVPRAGETVSNAAPLVAPLVIKRDQYPPKTPVKEEMTSAKQLQTDCLQRLESLISTMQKTGALAMEDVKPVSAGIVDSVLRNPDAFSWLARVKDKDDHVYGHDLRCAVWANLLGRHIGLNVKDLQILTMGVLLKDIGRLRLSEDLRYDIGLSREQQLEYFRFVEYGAEMLRGIPGTDPRVVSIVKNHRERVDGSGYLQQLKGDKIPLLAKIAGIVTYYDEITYPRGSSHPLPSSKAVAKLYEIRDTEFQEELVVEFIRAIGLYPTGTCVALSTGQVAVVVEQNFERRLKPKVIILLDGNKQPLPKPVLLDLAADDREKQALIDSGKKTIKEVAKIEITQDLEAGHYNLDIAKVRDAFFAETKPKKKGFFSFLRRD